MRTTIIPTMLPRRPRKGGSCPRMRKQRSSAAIPPRTTQAPRRRSRPSRSSRSQPSRLRRYLLRLRLLPHRRRSRPSRSSRSRPSRLRRYLLRLRLLPHRRRPRRRSGLHGRSGLPPRSAAAPPVRWKRRWRRKRTRFLCTITPVGTTITQVTTNGTIPMLSIRVPTISRVLEIGNT